METRVSMVPYRLECITKINYVLLSPLYLVLFMLLGNSTTDLNPYTYYSCHLNNLKW